jgi:uncharacterized protein DUF2330
MVRRALITLGLMTALIAGLPASAFACGGLIAGKHAEVLRSVTTLAAWHDGIEHYITGFSFAGAASSFGYIIPLPGVPSDIKKGGGWTLERLDREVFPPPPNQELAFAAGSAVADQARVQVLKEVKIDSLDIKVVKGGGADVAEWAKEHGFELTGDAPKLLQKYKAEIFALAKFDAKEAAGKFVEGQGVVIDFSIPLPSPWIPLQILTLGKHSNEPVLGHLFFLTDEAPAIAPAPEKIDGMRVAYNGWASEALIADLRSDKGTEWIPQTMWLTALEMNTQAHKVSYDLTAAVGGRLPPPLTPPPPAGTWLWWTVVTALAVAAAGTLRLSRGPGTTTA